MSTLQTTLLSEPSERFGYFGKLHVAGDRLWAVGGTRHKATLAVSTDGRHFYRRPTPNTPGLRAFLWLSESRLLVVGEYGMLAESLDGATTWRVIPTETRGCLFGLAQDASGAIWVAGDDGFVLRSASDARSFERVDLGTTSRISGLTVIDDVLYVRCHDGHLLAHCGGDTKTLFKAEHPVTSIVRTPTGALVVTGDGGLVLRAPSAGGAFETVKVDTSCDLEAIAVTAVGLAAVGAEGVIFVSRDDGRSFELIDNDATEHLWSLWPTGSGALIGGDDGALLWLHEADDTTWSARPDALADEPRASDALWAVAPDAFLTSELLKLPTGARPPEAELFEQIWGTPLPDELGAFLRLEEAGAFKERLYEWRPETERLPEAPDGENLFEFLVRRDQGAYLGTGLPEAFSGTVCLGSLGNGDTYLASIYDDRRASDDISVSPAGPRTLHCFDHEEHSLALVVSPSVSRFVYFSALAQAIQDESVSPKVARRALDGLAGGINPTWHFRSTVEAVLGKKEKLEGYEHPTMQSRYWEARARWIIYLLRNDGVVSVDDTKNLFHPNLNPVLDDALHARWKESSQEFVPTLLYALWRTFFFDDKARLRDYIAIAKASPSRLARDAGELARALEDGRKELGSIADIHDLRRRFIALDLDPARAEAREAEAKAKAAALAARRAEMRAAIEAKAIAGEDLTALLWDGLTDGPLHEAVEEVLRRDETLALTFAGLDFIVGTGWSRENLSLSHEKAHMLEALEDVGDARVVPLLLGAFLRDRDPAEAKEGPVRVASALPLQAAEILTAFVAKGRFDARMLPPLRRELDQEPERFEHRRVAATRLLGLARDGEAASRLIAIGEAKASDDFLASISMGDLNAAIAEALGRIGDAAAVPVLRRMVTESISSYKKAHSFAGMALAALGSVSDWKVILSAAASLDRKPAAFMLWAVGELGAKADAATRAEMVAAVTDWKPRYNVFYLELLQVGVRQRLGAAPEGFADTLARGLTVPGWDADTTDVQHTFALRLAAVSLALAGANAKQVAALRLRDERRVRDAAEEAARALGDEGTTPRRMDRLAVATLEAREGVPGLLVALADERAFFRYNVARRLGELGDVTARGGLLAFGKAQVDAIPREVAAVVPRDVGYALRWTLRALLELGPSSELITLAREALLHPHRDIRDPALRYAAELPADDSLVEPMLRVQEAKYGWQEGTAREWLEAWKGTPAYERALATLRA